MMHRMSTCTTGEDDDEGIGKDFVVAVLLLLLLLLMMMRTFDCSRFATSSFH